MAWYEADPVVDDKPSAKTEGEWWKSDPVVGEQSAEAPSGVTLADLMSGKYGNRIPKDVHIPTVNETGWIPAPIVEAALRYGNPLGWAQVAAEHYDPNNPIVQAGKGAIQGLSSTIAGATTPENLSLLALAPEGKLAQRLIAGTFLGQSIAGTPEQWDAFNKADNLADKFKIGTEMGLGLALPAAGLAHSFKVGEVPKTADASAVPKESSSVNVLEDSIAREILPPTTDANVSSDQSRLVVRESQVPQSEITIGGKSEQAPSVLEPNEAVAPPVSPKEFPQSPTGEPNAISQRSTETEVPSPIERGENQQVGGERVRPSEQGQEIAGTGQAPEESQVPLASSRVGIAHEYGEERFPGEIERGEGTTVEAQVERGRELLQRGVDPGQIIRRVERTGRVSGDDMSVLRAQLETFQHAADTTAEASRTNPGDPVLKRAAEQAMQNELGWRKTIKPAATVFHEIGMTLQGQAEVNYGTLEGLRRSAFDLHGKDVNPFQAARLKEAATRVRRETQLATESLQRATTQVERTLGRKAPPRSVEQLRSDLANRLRELTPC